MGHFFFILFTMKSLGWIALDIDGTITKDKYSIPSEVSAYLHSLSTEGWTIVFLTGRSFRFASLTLKSLPFPFFCAAQNGSLILEMPAKKAVFEAYLEEGSLSIFQSCFEGLSGNFLVYSGAEKGDFCYYRPDRLSGSDLKYTEEIISREQGQKKPYHDFKEIGRSPLIKCFGPSKSMKELQKRLDEKKLFNSTLIRDPFREGEYLLLVTDIHASKGKALEALLKKHPKGKALICAGDDENDLSMFAVADFAIAMEEAPENVKEQADLIAPSVEEMGIIAALKSALGRFA
jgi:Cof subfamily protein (haloacid dehalogenase superfamily)